MSTRRTPARPTTRRADVAPRPRPAARATRPNHHPWAAGRRTCARCGRLCHPPRGRWRRSSTCRRWGTCRRPISLPPSCRSSSRSQPTARGARDTREMYARRLAHTARLDALHVAQADGMLRCRLPRRDLRQPAVAARVGRAFATGGAVASVRTCRRDRRGRARHDCASSRRRAVDVELARSRRPAGALLRQALFAPARGVIAT